MSENEPADPIPRGTWATIKQSWGDLFVWKMRVEVVNELGEKRTEWQDPEPLKNPISLVAELTAKNWLFYLVGLFAWIADAFDFHALSIQTVKLADYYDTSKTSVSTAITLTLLLRSVGAAFFGFAGDKWGRKWPMVVNMLVLGALQVATIYSVTFQQFLAVRSLFGLFMGGVYGNAIAMALENCPVNSRGLMSGILQQGYSMGYVFAACANLGVGGSTESWKIVFWIAAGLSFLAGIIRIFLPESQQFIRAKEEGKKKNIAPGAFWADVKMMIKDEWKMVVYCIILMTWFNYYSHTSQDSYTTFMRTQKYLDNAKASRASIIMKTGACVGGTIMGYASQFYGRRRTIIVSAILSGALIPAWILPEGERSLSATGFFMQFFVQGAWGVIPIHLNELSPPAFRSSFPGITYQVGNMISSPSAQIVNAVAENVKIWGRGEWVPSYGPTMAVATAIIATGITLTTAIGPEKRGRRFEEARAAGAVETGPKDLEEGAVSGKIDDKDLEPNSEHVPEYAEKGLPAKH